MHACMTLAKAVLTALTWRSVLPFFPLHTVRTVRVSRKIGVGLSRHVQTAVFFFLSSARFIFLSLSLPPPLFAQQGRGDARGACAPRLQLRVRQHGAAIPRRNVPTRRPGGAARHPRYVGVGLGWGWAAWAVDLARLFVSRFM